MSPDGGKSPPDQIPQVYYGRKASRREQDVTGRSIDWLRLKIGEGGWIDTLGAWTESWTLSEREACDYCREGTMEGNTEGEYFFYYFILSFFVEIQLTGKREMENSQSGCFPRCKMVVENWYHQCQGLL